MLATIPCATVLGVDGRAVSVEVHVSNGVPAFAIVGLPDAACRESRDRVRAALLSSQLAWPLKRVTVNLAPSGVRKAGAGFDLAIAVGLLVAAGELPPDAVAGCSFIGELGLDGSIRPVPGVVPMVDAVTTPAVVVPRPCAREAGLVGRHDVRCASTLGELVAALSGSAPWPELPEPHPAADGGRTPDLADIRGQAAARKAVEVAAAGGHHVLLLGPPGAGKTMLAARLPGLLPPLEREEALQVTRIHSAAGITLPASGLVRQPPFRAPHHGASEVSLVGGGTAWMRPGEISAAHCGVLFLDELGEFAPSVLDSLRQPLEEGVVRVSRARASVTYPARFLLVAAMNPCPCGEGGRPGDCECSDAARARYIRRLSGPLVDRFDLRIQVSRPDPRELIEGEPGEPSASVAARVAAARQRAQQRGVRCNAEVAHWQLDEVAPVTREAAAVLEGQLRAGKLSARGFHRVRRVALTLADLDGVDPPVPAEQVCLALQMRCEPKAALQGAVA